MNARDGHSYARETQLRREGERERKDQRMINQQSNEQRSEGKRLTAQGENPKEEQRKEMPINVVVPIDRLYGCHQRLCWCAEGLIARLMPAARKKRKRTRIVAQGDGIVSKESKEKTKGDLQGEENNTFQSPLDTASSELRQANP